MAATAGTDVLVIGSGGNPNWAESSYGRKIEEAMLRRLDTGKPVIIDEETWIEKLGLNSPP